MVGYRLCPQEHPGPSRIRDTRDLDLTYHYIPVSPTHTAQPKLVLKTSLQNPTFALKSLLPPGHLDYNLYHSPLFLAIISVSKLSKPSTVSYLFTSPLPITAGAWHTYGLITHFLKQLKKCLCKVTPHLSSNRDVHICEENKCDF